MLGVAIVLVRRLIVKPPSPFDSKVSLTLATELHLENCGGVAIEIVTQKYANTG